VSDGAWELRKSTAGLWPALLSNSASYPHLAGKPFAFPLIYLGGFMKEGGGKKKKSAWASFAATHGGLFHVLDA